jgi:hypothetical protein
MLRLWNLKTFDQFLVAYFPYRRDFEETCVSKFEQLWKLRFPNAILHLWLRDVGAQQLYLPSTSNPRGTWVLKIGTDWRSFSISKHFLKGRERSAKEKHRAKGETGQVATALAYHVLAACWASRSCKFSVNQPQRLRQKVAQNASRQVQRKWSFFNACGTRLLAPVSLSSDKWPTHAPYHVCSQSLQKGIKHGCEALRAKIWRWCVATEVFFISLFRVWLMVLMKIQSYPNTPHDF